MTGPGGLVEEPDADEPVLQCIATDAQQGQQLDLLRQLRNGEWDVLLDDGRELAFIADALRPPVRLLRSGQRVLLHVVDGAVTVLTLASRPLFARSRTGSRPGGGPARTTCPAGRVPVRHRGCPSGRASFV